MTLGMLLLTAAACMAQKTGELVFEKVAYADSLICDAKIMDYSSDAEPTPYTIGKSRNYFNMETVEAVDGPDKAVTFINQWLVVNAAGIGMEGAVNAKTVAAKYATLKNKPGVSTAVRTRGKQFLTPEAPDEIPELPWETGDEFDNSVSVVKSTPKYVTIYDVGSIYNAGAAHGMPWECYYTFDLQQMRLLTVNDIFTKAGKRKVLQMIVKELRSEYADEGLNSKIDFPGNEPAFTDDGILFSYGAYEIGPFSLGLPSVTLPYKKVQQYLTPQAKALLK